jgi:hypothetical protein
MSRSRRLGGMLFALSEAVKADIAIIAIWLIAFPALVTGLIVFAIAQATAERAQNLERRNRRTRSGP